MRRSAAFWDNARPTFRPSPAAVPHGAHLPRQGGDEHSHQRIAAPEYRARLGQHGRPGPTQHDEHSGNPDPDAHQKSAPYAEPYPPTATNRADHQRRAEGHRQNDEPPQKQWPHCRGQRPVHFFAQHPSPIIPSGYSHQMHCGWQCETARRIHLPWKSPVARSVKSECTQTLAR